MALSVNNLGGGESQAKSYIPINVEFITSQTSDSKYAWTMNVKKDDVIMILGVVSSLNNNLQYLTGLSTDNFILLNNQPSYIWYDNYNLLRDYSTKQINVDSSLQPFARDSESGDQRHSYFSTAGNLLCVEDSVLSWTPQNISLNPLQIIQFRKLKMETYDRFATSSISTTETTLAPPQNKILLAIANTAYSQNGYCRFKLTVNGKAATDYDSLPFEPLSKCRCQTQDKVYIRLGCQLVKYSTVSANRIAPYMTSASGYYIAYSLPIIN